MKKPNTVTRLIYFTFLIAIFIPLMGCPPPPTHNASIYTDIHGVPHIYADTEYEVMYGFGYAMAFDQLETIVSMYRSANGTRAARKGAGPGGSYILSDYITHLFRVPESAQAAYSSMNEQQRSWLNGFSSGLNRYIQDYNKDHTPKAETFTATDVLAWSIYGQFSRQLRHALKDKDRSGEPDSMLLNGLFSNEEEAASNQWVVGPSKTGDGPAMLQADPHLPWFGETHWYEAHLKNTDGKLNVTGAAVLGTPLIAIGRNGSVAWSMTSNEMLDYADCYKEKLANPGEFTEYVYAPAPSGKKPIVQRTITIQVKGSSPVVVPAYYTHHGPIVPDLVNNQLVFSPDNEYIYSLALSMMDGTEENYPGDLITGMLLQTYRFDTARSVRDMMLALGLQTEADSYPKEEGLQMVKWNIVMGDVAGDIHYIYNGRIPVRKEAHQEDPEYWDRPREGWTGEDEWLRDEVGGHAKHWAIAELPQVDGSNCTYMANCNVSPWHVCPTSGINPSDFPYYVCMESMTDRQRRILELLEADELITEEDMRRYSRDTHLLKADKLEDLFFYFYDPAVYPDLNEAAELLRSKPNEATMDNTSVALLFRWSVRLGGAYDALPDDPAELTPEQQALLVNTLREARNELEACPFGLDPKWGQVHQIHHGGVFPVAGGTNMLTSLFLVAGSLEGCGPMVCDHGSSFMQVSVLTQGGATSRSVRPIGSSSDPASPHYNDETARYVEEDPELAYKVNPFTDQELTEYHELTTELTW